MGKSEVSSHYGGIAILLHWLTVLLVLMTVLAIELYPLIPRDNSLRGALEDWHVYLGFLLLPIILIRFLNIRRTIAPPISPPLSRWQMALTRWMKLWLYVFLFGMPLSGWIYLSADGAMINLWAFPILPAVPESPVLARLARQAHLLLGLTGYGLIALHVCAALFQHYLARNNSLLRMLPRFLQRKS